MMLNVHDVSKKTWNKTVHKCNISVAFSTSGMRERERELDDGMRWLAEAVALLTARRHPRPRPR
jgi:hypothetical protein